MIRLTTIVSYGLCFSLWFFTGCSSSNDPKPFNCADSDLGINVTKTDPVDCSSEGVVVIEGLLGNEPYLFSLDAGAFQSSGTFSNVTSGTHRARVKDNKGCIAEEDISLAAPSSTAEIQNVTQESSGCKTSNGSITVIAVGSGTLSYSLDNIDFTNPTGVFNGLPKGTYSVFVKDGDQCMDSQSNIKITTGVSLEANIKPIIDSNCAVSNCHVSGGSAPFSLETKSQIIAHASGVKSSTQGSNNSMPKNNTGSFSQTNKDLIACWVDDGAPNN